MTIVKLQWWLWNQMFQYAYIRALSMRINSDFLLDISEYETYFRKFELEIFDIQKKYATKNQIPWFERVHIKNIYLNAIIFRIKLFLKKHSSNYYLEQKFNFDSKCLINSAEYIEWFFQSEKYFSDSEDQIRKDFTFMNVPSERNMEVIKIIQSSNSVSIHVRRWDYVTNPSANSTLGTCNVDYYNNAIEYIQSKIDVPTFFFFSDDIAWVKENIKVENNSYYIDWNSWDQSYEDMRLMTLCKHNIIANSSFSWWWAWLNKNISKIVIAPQRWFNDVNMNDSDVVPEKWIKI